MFVFQYLKLRGPHIRTLGRVDRTFRAAVSDSVDVIGSVGSAAEELSHTPFRSSTFATYHHDRNPRAFVTGPLIPQSSVLGRAVTPNPSAPHSHQVRGVSKNGKEIRKGNCIEKDGKLLQVTYAKHTQGLGRAAGHVQLEVRDLRSGAKATERVRPDEKVEVVETENKKFQYLYTDGNAVHVMDPQSFEQLVVQEELVADVAPWLHPDVPLTLHFVEQELVSVAVPKKVEQQVVQAENSDGNLRADGRENKKCTLANGLVIQIPGYVDAGEFIIVNTETATFDSRSR